MSEKKEIRAHPKASVSICPSCINLETRREGTLQRCRRIDPMERELGEKSALLQIKATFRGEHQSCHYFEKGPGRLFIE